MGGYPEKTGAPAQRLSTKVLRSFSGYDERTRLKLPQPQADRPKPCERRVWA